jgi:hypothetical protein
MKRLFFLSVLLVNAALFHSSFANSIDEPVPTYSRGPIKTLIINANVTVALIDSDKISAEATGSSKFLSQLRMEQRSDTLVINSTKKNDMKDGGVIYISANRLATIRVNSPALVKSMQTLQVARLDVVINGECEIRVSNTGLTNLIETSQFAVEQTRTVRQWPASVFVKKELH